MPPSPIDLRVNDATTPLGVAPAAPVFSWRFPPDTTVIQSAYRIVVAMDEPVNQTAVVWDSGTVDTGDQRVHYDGPPLDPCERWYWAVRVWINGDASDWCQSWWETGPTDWTAEWIAGPAADDGLPDGKPSPAPYFRHNFTVHQPEEVSAARLYLATAGYHEPYLNGDPIGDHVIDPGPSDYEARVRYVTFDVTASIRADNVLAVACGRARYADPTPNTWRWHEAPWHAEGPHLSAMLDIKYSGGDRQRVVTDDHWQAGTGGTRRDSLFEGEVFDERREPNEWQDVDFDASTWPPAVIVAGPNGTRTPQCAPPVRVQRRIHPTSRTKVADGAYVYDVGEVVTGWASITAAGTAGDELTITYGERVSEDGRVDPRDVSRGEQVRSFVEGRLQTDRLTLDGEGTTTWAPRFSYRGFQYIQIDGTTSPPPGTDIEVEVLHSDIHWDEDGTTFACQSSLLEQIRQNCRRAIENNVHGVPTDTPMYEKNGWTGDALCSAEAVLYEYDATRFFRQWLEDMADAQLDSGELPVIVPTSDWGYSEGGQFENEGTGGYLTPVWDAAYVYLTWWLYRYVGDTETLASHYDGMVALFSFIEDRCEHDIIESGHGDHLAPERHPDGTPLEREGPAICSTAYYYGMATVIADAAAVLDRPTDAATYSQRAIEIGTAFNDRFFDAESGVYRTGDVDTYRQTSNLLPLAFDLVPPDQRDRVAATLVDDIHSTHDNHLSTGVIGTKHFFRTLTDLGYVDLAYDVATQRTYPSYGYWLELGATALYEWWEAHSRSRDHHMFGSIDDWFLGRLAGIEPAAPGFERIQIRPYLPSNLAHCQSRVRTVRGSVESTWNQRGPDTELVVTIPSNTGADIHLPTTSHAHVHTLGAGARYTGMTENRPTYSVGPGTWTFRWHH